jgi:polysaccharide export outer membrane protein
MTSNQFAVVRRISSAALLVSLALPSAAIPSISPTPVSSSPPQGQPSRLQQGAKAAPRYDPDLYVLGPGDQLQLVFLDPTAAGLGSSFAILNDGTATLSLLGTVQLTGLTIGQANRWLTSLYSKQLLRPNLYLNITNPRPMSVTVLGEVQTPGLYQLNTQGEASTVQGSAVGSPGFPTVVTAIQKAGGITLNADVRQVILRRMLPGTSGAQKQIDLNLAELLQIGNQLQNPLLFDGDTIIVTKAPQQLPQELMELSASNLTPQTISVNVVGEVKAPGRIALPANSPLSTAILTAGGPNNWRANKGRIELLRIQRNGTATRESFALDYSKGVLAGQNPPLKNNDTLIVHRSLYGKSIDVINQVIVPLSTIGSFWNLFNYYR